MGKKKDFQFFFSKQFQKQFGNNMSSETGSLISDLFKERSRNFRERELKKTFNERIVSMFDVVFLRRQHLENKDLIKREIDSLLKTVNNNFKLEEAIRNYAHFLYNSETFVSFETFYETHIKSREEKIEELFEKLKFELPRDVYFKKDEFIKNTDLSFENVRDIILGIEKESISASEPVKARTPVKAITPLKARTPSSETALVKYEIRFLNDDSVVLGPFSSLEEAEKVLYNNYNDEEMYICSSF